MYFIVRNLFNLWNLDISLRILNQTNYSKLLLEGNIKEMKSKDIVCGKHYESMHMCNVYSSDKSYDCILSERISKRTVSLPFHEELAELDIDKVIGEVNGFTK